jgi:heme-degrading monooxygenase HmoA
MVIQFVKFKSGLSEEELLEVAHDRLPQFQALSGLVQKYYFKDEREGKFGGIYIWDSMESLQAFRNSDLAASIPKAYKTLEAPDIQVLDLLFPLRN